MKKTFRYMALALVGAAMAGCSDTFEPAIEGEGSLTLNTTASTDMTVVSRAAGDDLAAELGSSLVVYISNAQGVVRQFRGADQIPATPLPLLSGHYTAQGWAGDSVSASWTERCFKGIAEFDITRGTTTAVTLPLTIANTAVEVALGEGVEGVLGNISVKVGHVKGELVFEGEHMADRGYFMFPSYDHNLRYTLSGTLLDGTPLEVAGTIEDPQPATCYRLNVTYTPGEHNVGGAWFTITVDDQAIEIRNELNIVTPPTISGYDFDINSTVTGEQGTIGRRTFYISTASVLRDVTLASDDLTAVIGEEAIDFLNATDVSAINTLAAAGVTFRVLDHDFYGNPVEANKLVQINLDEAYANNLENGVHVYTVTATDQQGRTSQGSLTINVSSAPVATMPLAADDLTIRTDRATLHGTVLKDGVSNVGFNYRAAGTGAWTYAAATPDSRSLAVGATFSATVEGLTPSTTYEYVVVADDFVGAIPETFTTDAAPQLPNASFEEWSTDGKAVIPALSVAAKFWDSGNYGSATMNKNITDKSTDFVHSGTYSAKLVSQFVGIGSIGKFAAGNIFVGKYLKTDGTDGVLGWGRPFTGRPVAMKVWVRYEPGTVNSKGAVNGYLNTGDTDQGAIYVALTDGTTQEYGGEQWPAVIKTKASERQLFNPEGANVIAYGGQFFTEATAGSGLVEITIPLDYRRTDVRPSNIILVASASRYGDYFCGGEGSTLWIDDVQLVY